MNAANQAPELASSKTQDLVQLEGLIVKGVAEARKSIQAQRKERALLYLRKNKLYDHNIKNIDDYLLNVEQVSIPQQVHIYLTGTFARMPEKHG